MAWAANQPTCLPNLSKMSTTNQQKERSMEDEIDPNKAAEVAIGVFIGLMAFKVVKLVIRAICE